MKSSYHNLKIGGVLVEKRETVGPGLSSDVPDGMVHHWIGIVFLPGVTLAQGLPVVKDDDRRAELYKPAVTSSPLIFHQGNDYRFFLRLYQKRFSDLSVRFSCVQARYSGNGTLIAGLGLDCERIHATPYLFFRG